MHHPNPKGDLESDSITVSWLREQRVPKHLLGGAQIM